MACSYYTINAQNHSTTAGKQVNKEIYSIQEVIDNFNALLKDADFTNEFTILQLSKFQFKKKKMLLLEFSSLYIALWKYAMTFSFPSDGQLIFDSFLEKYTRQNTLDEIKIIKDRISQYTALLTLYDNNYLYVSAHIISFAKLDEPLIKPTTLRIALAIRQRYTQIFERLI